MDKNNFLSWRSQFMDVLELHDLEDVITYETRPQKKLTDGTPNPAYSKDKRSPLSKTYLRTLWDQIRTLKRDSEQPVADYLMHAKSLFDSVTAANTTMSDEEFIEYILDGIGHKRTTIKENPPVSTDCVVTDDNHVQGSRSQSYSKNSGRGPGRGGNHSRDNQSWGWQSSRDHSSRDGGQPNQDSFPRSMSWNHNYDNRSNFGQDGQSTFTQTRLGFNQHSEQTPFITRGSLSDGKPPLLPTPIARYEVMCQLCNKQGHVARVCPERGNYTNVNLNENTSWCLDSGATHHRAGNLSTLPYTQPYTGTDTIIVGNGNHLANTYWEH
ncbi:hypothetical protein L3X38_034098 [Prunus dulcis]|uniref:CCHC-type domain-containing protein n=1 Tax=Prunus dulcis TaxID=3755 RepID=A0AAD4VH84_PRUDU|nr:hypothetical protein L3X38_034098 [Prunus dulcis]